MSDSTPPTLEPRTVDAYLDLVPAYNRVQPDFTAVLSAVLQPFVDAQNMLAAMPYQFDLDFATGVQLDQVGIWIGRNRFIAVPITGVFFSWDTDNLGWEQGYWQGTFDPDTGITTLDDETYRTLLYAKAAANGWDGSFQEVVSILNTLLANENVTVTVYDNQDMTMSVVVNGLVNDLVFANILQGGYLPIKPEGVAITYTVTTVVPKLVGASANFAGSGALTPQSGSIIIRRTASARLSGAGGLNVNAIRLGGSFLTANATFAGAGALAPPAVARRIALATLAGAGRVRVDATGLSGMQFATGNADNVLSGGNLIVTRSGDDGRYASMVANRFKATGKFYCEVSMVLAAGQTTQSDVLFGIANASFPAGTLDDYLGIDANSWGYFSGGEVTGNVSTQGDAPTFATGNTVSIALDMTNFKWWVRVNGGAWNGGGDPGLNSGGFVIPTALRTGGVTIGVTTFNTGDKLTGVFSAANWTYTPPGGFGQF